MAFEAALVVLAALVVVAFYVLAQLMRALVGTVLVNKQVHGSAVLLATRFVGTVFVIVGILIAMSVVLQSANVAIAGVLAATVVASLGVQDLLRDYVSGFYVLFERQIRVGDHVVVGVDGAGTITDIGLRVTLLRGDDGQVVVVPNSRLFNQAVAVTRPVPASPKASRTDPQG